MRVFNTLLSATYLAPIVVGLLGHSAAFAQTPAPITATGQPVTAQKIDAHKDQAATDFAQALLAINTMSGDFVQRIFDNQGEQMQVTQGEFKIKRPGYFYWKVLPPFEQIVIGTPESLKIYDPDLDQLSIHNQNSLSGTPASLISGDFALISHDYNVSQKDDAGMLAFELRQKNSELSAFEMLSFFFVKNSGALLLNKMVFVDKLGQRTDVVMSKVDTNTALDTAVFNFDPPAGTDVIVDG